VVKGKCWAFCSFITPNLRRNTTQAYKRLRQPQRWCGRVNEGNNHSCEGEQSCCPAHSHCSNWAIYLMADNDGVSPWMVGWVVTNGLASMCTESIADQPEVTYSAVIRLEELRKSRKNSHGTWSPSWDLNPEHSELNVGVLNNPSQLGWLRCKFTPIVCFVDRASLYIRITWTNKVYYFLLIYFNSKPLNVSSRLAAHHQEDQLCINSNWLCWLAAGSNR